jgi:hypothetical protein
MARHFGLRLKIRSTPATIERRYAIGLALTSLLIVTGWSAWFASRGFAYWHALSGPMFLAWRPLIVDISAGVGLYFGATIALALTRSTISKASQFIALWLLVPCFAFPIAALISGIGTVGHPVGALFALYLGVKGFGLPCLVVCAMWSALYVFYGRPIASTTHLPEPLR